MKQPLAPARWVWADLPPAPNQTVDFLCSFTVSDPAACRVFVSVNGQYALYLDGAFVANDQFADYETWKVYDELSLCGHVHIGSNRLSLGAYWQGEASSTWRPFAPGVCFAVYEGERLLAASGETTLCRQNTRYAAAGVEKITGQLGYSFCYDATAPLPAAAPARVLAHDWPLHPRPVKKLRLDPPLPAAVAALGTMQPAGENSPACVTIPSCADTPTGENAPANAAVPTHALTQPPVPTPARRLQNAPLVAAAPPAATRLPTAGGLTLTGNFVLLDLGSEQVGYFLLDVELRTPGEILIGWGEHLEDLRVRTAVGGRNFAARCRVGAGRTRFFYPYKRLGLRYVQLWLPGAGILHYAGVRPAFYPLERVNLFTCADRLQAQIYRTGLRTLLHCMHEHYEDCPWREQALYTMDSRNQMLCGYYAFEEYDFARASLRLMALSLRADHTLELTSPGKVDITIPSFTAIYLVQLGEYLRYSGDGAFVRTVLPVARDIAEGFLARVEQNGLIRRFAGREYWNFYEWQTGLAGRCGAEEPEEQTAFDAPLAAFVSLGLQQMEYICEKLGQPEDARRYGAAAAELNAAIDRVFWQPEKGWYATTLTADGRLVHACELTQALAVCCGAVPRARLEGVLRTLTGGMGADFYPVTLSHSIFKYEALLRLPARYGRLVFGQLADIFGGMLYRGATTFWETADGAAAFEKAGSLCHAWSAVPVYFMLRYCLDSRGEGTKLPPEVTGIYEPGMQSFADAARRIVDDDWGR